MLLMTCITWRSVRCRLLDILEIFAPQFKHFARLREFIDNNLPPGFPVKLGKNSKHKHTRAWKFRYSDQQDCVVLPSDLPVFPTISAKVTFQEFEWLDNSDSSRFTIPEGYKWETHKLLLYSCSKQMHKTWWLCFFQRGSAQISRFMRHSRAGRRSLQHCHQLPPPRPLTRYSARWRHDGRRARTRDRFWCANDELGWVQCSLHCFDLNSFFLYCTSHFLGSGEVLGYEFIGRINKTELSPEFITVGRHCTKWFLSF